MNELEYLCFDFLAMLEFGQCVFGGHCYAKFGVFCAGNGHGLSVDGSKHGIDDRLGIACFVTARKGC